MQLIKVSVVIPIYNVERFISRCLESVLSQTWDNLQVILIDDCSPDESILKAQKLLTSNPRRDIVEIIHHEKNKGLSGARNTGIQQSKGDYILFLDSDDFLANDKSIENLVAASHDALDDFVIGDYKIDGKYRQLPSLSIKENRVVGNRNIINTYADNKWYVMAWNKLIKRNFLLENNLFFYEGIVHEDDLWTFKLAITAETMGICHEQTYCYFLQPQSITGSPSLKNLECRLKVMQLMTEEVKNNPRAAKEKAVFSLLEKLKAKYMDRIIAFTNDKDFIKKAYNVMRTSCYRPPIRSSFSLALPLPAIIKSLHYAMTPSIGKAYFIMLVKLDYYLLVIWQRLTRK